MAKIYYKRIKAGIMTIDDVPARKVKHGRFNYQK